MAPASTARDPVPPVVEQTLAEFRQAFGLGVCAWIRTPEGWECRPQGMEPAARPGPGPHAVEVPTRGAPEVWVEVDGGEDGRGAARFLASQLGHLLRHDAEARFFGRELAERYEEITLLYSISEILGSVISLQQAASTILAEVVETLGVRRAALWIYSGERRRLELIAAVGVDGQSGPIEAGDQDSVTATVFRERRPMILEPEEEFPRGGFRVDPAYRGSFLSVPVNYTPPDGAPRTIGVINLIGRRSEERFSAGDQKLTSAIASQIGAAVENNRLVEASLRQERMVREMELAHDLQLKLLPPLEQFSGYAEVAARCVPADSVGGDFYHLFRLSGGRFGVVIGDVSSHGFGAALIMALAMSAIAIHASEGDSPGEVLRRTHQALIDELESTEMYLTLFYGVIDPAAERITYTNAGHSHAFRVAASGEATRLGATNPPLGIVDLDTYREEVAPWRPGEDLLFLFTDGLSDALGAGEVEGERILLDEVVRRRGEPAGDLLQRLFQLPEEASDVPGDDRTVVLVRL
jgi:phosphoserine phosphatase RsbU/P